MKSIKEFIVWLFTPPTGWPFWFPWVWYPFWLAVGWWIGGLL